MRMDIIPFDPSGDPEIMALLDFEPVPRQRIVAGTWTPELQREFVARLAVLGSPGRVCEEMGKDLTGVRKLYRSPLAASFREAWDGAIALAKRRRAEAARQEYVSPGTRPPSIDHRRKTPPSNLPSGAAEGGVPGQRLNEFDEYEDEQSLQRRAEEARDSISGKLRGARRLYLREISGSAGKRAAFEILTELPVDWERASRLEPQADEPWRRPTMRQGDMLLTADNGWLGDMAHGPDKKAELRREIDEYRKEIGLEPVDWSGDNDDDE
jgi:hypothetical protein